MIIFNYRSKTETKVGTKKERQQVNIKHYDKVGTTNINGKGEKKKSRKI